MATLTELARFHTALDGRARQPPPAPGRRLGPAGRLLLRRPAAVRADGRRRGRRPLPRARPGPPVDLADRLPGRLDRHGRHRGGATARGPGLPRRRDHRGRDHDRRAQGAGARRSRIPVRCRGEVVGGAHPGVGAVVRPPAGRARAHLRRHLQPLRPHDRGRRVPVRRAGHRDRGGAPRRRRRDPPRCVDAGGVHVAQRRVGAAPHRRRTATPRACASASSASTTR